MKCPNCGSTRTQATNLGERIFARTVSVGAAIAAHMVSPSVGHTAMHETNKGLCKERKYICLSCKEEFSVNRY